MSSNESFLNADKLLIRGNSDIIFPQRIRKLLVKFDIIESSASSASLTIGSSVRLTLGGTASTHFALTMRIYVFGDLFAPPLFSIHLRAMLDICGSFKGVDKLTVYGQLAFGDNCRVGATSNDGHVKLTSLRIDNRNALVTKSNCTSSSNKIVSII